MATKKIETKKEATKAIAKAVETKKSQEDKVMKKEVKAVETKKVENVEKKNSFISIQEATVLYAEAGIKCKNPDAKGNYRIMGSGSSLNIKPMKGYYIYTSDEDFANVSTAGIKASDLIIEEGTNAQDKTRPNTIICTAVETLKSLLQVYATNPKNALVQETAVVTK